MKKTLIAAAVAAACAAPSVVLAQDAGSPHSFTANAGVVTDYLFRGISQSHGKPALQGGVDYAHSSGLYAGVWGSTIKWVDDQQDRSVPLEIDVYGGYKNTIGASDWSYDIGYMTYNYPGTKTTTANSSAKANTQEVYGAISWKWLTAKYSYVTSSHFVAWYGGATGTDTNKNTRGSDYLELNANYDLGNGWGVNGHIGKQKVKNYVASGQTDASYMDWKVGVTKDVGYGVVGLAYSDTDVKGICSQDAGSNTNAYCWGEYNRGSNSSTNFRNAAQGQVVLSFSKTF